MQLKKLELYGFKSFSDKTVIEFDKGITGIVGPNGCGKSNIVDSVMWVLGEQSVKNLRGSRMDDVVFKGSDKRKPNGFAEVSITLDNSDGVLPISYNEVNISRRLYRSGDSLYRINGTECRLKDITSLFLDSGIGKYGYSIIGQGRVSEILNATPEGRRYIFDEAAGIMKYKTRKDEAQKHLFLTNENLSRANDLIYEIESRLPSLKIAAEKAEKYIGVANQLKAYEVARYVLLHERYSQQEKKLQDQIDLLANDVEQNEKARVQASQRLEDINSRFDVVNEQCEKLRANRVESVRMAERLKGELKYLAEREQTLVQTQNTNNENIERYTLEANAAAEFIEDEAARNAQALKELEEATLKECAQADRVQKLREEYDAIVSRLNSARENQLESVNKVNTNSLMLAQLTTKQEMLSGRVQGDDEDSKEIDSKLLETQLLCEDAKNEVTKLLDELKSARNNLEELNKEYNGIRDEYNELASKAEALAKTAEAQKARLSTLNEMKESMDAYNNSTRAVIRLKSSNMPFADEIIGTVSDIIRVEKQYETAIEVALGAAVQNIVVKTDSGAKKIIEHLRNNRLGYATFLPLNSVQGRRISESDMRNLRQKGFLGIAADLIRFDSEYTCIAENLLGRVVIAENMDSAMNIARQSKYLFRIVTLEGDVINPYGSISGGSRAKSNVSNVFSRSREMDELEQNLKNSTDKLKEYNEKAIILKQRRDELNKRIEESRALEHDADVKYIAAKRGSEYAEAEFEKLKKSKQQSESRKLNIADELKRVESEIEDVRAQSAKLKESLVIANAGLDELVQKEAESKRELTRGELELTDCKLKVMECDSKARVITSSLDELTSRRDDRMTRVSELEAENNEITVQLKLTRENAEQNKALIEEYEAKEQDEVRVLKECEDDLKELEKTTRAREEEIRSLESMLLEINSKLHDLEMDKTKVMMENDNLQSRMWEMYQVSLGDALSAEPLEGDLETFNKSIRDLKADITRMGTINPEAPQQYQEQSEKYKTLCSERDDLNSASADIQKLIAQITSEMRVRFDEEFKIINSYFTEMFSILFSGGTARLELCNSDDILEAGIDIIAQPPGKKLQNISLMSGGEKALIATALLFALLKRRPAPFCILDEIDTALDEKNVYSLAKLVQTFDDKIQFIIISHRKGTMEASNVLYGVSMAEKGVSSLVSVKLEDAVSEQ